MAEDKGSDLDVFEGLTKKKSSIPAAPETKRGGVGATSSRLPPPSKKAPPSSLPAPKAPPASKRSSSSALPAPKPPKSKRSGAGRDSETPALSVKPASVGALVGDSGRPPAGGPSPASSAPATAELDWDDDEEATSVFDRSTSDLFGDLGPAKSGRAPASAAPSSLKPDVGKAAALLASSGRSAKPVERRAVSVEPMPRIPAPAPVPRDISGPGSSGAVSGTGAGATSRGPAAASSRPPSWSPSQAAAAIPETERTRTESDGQSRGTSKSLLLLVAAAMVALGIAGVFYLRSASDAEVTINASHKKKSVETAKVYINGQKRCDFTPCVVELKPGAANIRVVYGQLAGRNTIEVEGGKSMSVDIALGVDPELAPPLPSADESASPDEPKAPAKLSLATTMKDAEVTVLIDGKEKGKLPLELDGLEPGEVELTFVGGDTFGKVTKKVTLEPGKTFSIDDIKLPLLKVKTIFALVTRGAEVELVEVRDGGTDETSKLAFVGGKVEQTLDTTKKWKVVARLSGYRDYEKVLDFDGVEEKLELDIELEKEEAPTETPVATPGPQPPTSEPQPPAPTSDTASQFGFINANSVPPSSVIIDGRPRGQTPVSGVKVTAGSHTVVFKHSSRGTMSRTVSVGAGKTATAVVRFKAEEPAPAPAATKKKKKKKKKK
ncbi:MAG: PEGA domain-containing protein [Myxococcota bacterium]